MASRVLVPQPGKSLDGSITFNVDCMLCVKNWTNYRGGNKNLKIDKIDGPGVFNLPPNAGDMSSIPGQGTKIPHTSGK